MNSSFVPREASFAKHTILAHSTDQCRIPFPFLRVTCHASRFTGIS
jgi:hypothetical protein